MTLSENHNTSTASPRWATYPDAKTLYGLSRYTFWRLARDGHIKIARVGGRTLVECASVEEYLNELAEK